MLTQTDVLKFVAADNEGLTAKEILHAFVSGTIVLGVELHNIQNKVSKLTTNRMLYIKKEETKSFRHTYYLTEDGQEHIDTLEGKNKGRNNSITFTVTR